VAENKSSAFKRAQPFRKHARRALIYDCNYLQIDRVATTEHNLPQVWADRLFLYLPGTLSSYRLFTRHSARCMEGPSCSASLFSKPRHGSIRGGKISMKILRISCMFGGFLSLALSLSAQTFTTVLSFDNADGAFPSAPLVQATNGDLYGTTTAGGASSDGTVFKVTPKGVLTTLYSFCSQNGCTDGDNPQAGLMQATNGDLYGTTCGSGAVCSGGSGDGTVFHITPSGKLTTLRNFDGADGLNPDAGLVQATNGELYGTTYGGGANGYGEVFKITPGGKPTILHSFGGTDGENPQAGLVQATNGDLYGTTYEGGANGYGTVFKIAPSGKLTMLYSFCAQGGKCADGANPVAALIQATNGNFYGTTVYGAKGGGTVFKITPGGTVATLYSFCSKRKCTDGAGPAGALIQATDGNFYGTTLGGGSYDGGTVFKLAPSGKLTVLYSFCAQGGKCVDGYFPVAALVQNTNGNFYGTTSGGGSADCGGGHGGGPCGTIFSVSVGLGPFVETQPASGKVGAAVKILGTDLTGASSVTFSGTAAAFKVVSASLIATTVPEGTTTGTVEVTTPAGTLRSNVVFRVTK
jgi:uncharacterized repeat protein (TIGR03803 family)